MGQGIKAGVLARSREIAGLFALAVTVALCAGAISLSSSGQAWADPVSTPDEFVAKAADTSVTSIEVTSNMDMTGKGFVDVSGKVVDLGGNTVSSDNFKFGLHGSSFSVKNGTFKVNGSGNYALFIGDDPTSDVVIESVVTIGGINVYNSTNVTLRNVSVTGGPQYYALWCDKGAQVTVESGTFSSPGAAVLGLAKGENNQKMSIQGGTFATSAGQSLVYEGNPEAALPTITGGTFDTADVVKYVPENSAALGDSGSFEVMNKQEAAGKAAGAVDGIYYKTAAEAASAAEAVGGTVAPSYKVIFTGEGVVDSFAFADENSTITVPAEPIREGYKFAGWLNGDARWDFANNVVTGPLTLVAAWTPIAAPVEPGAGDGDPNKPTDDAENTTSGTTEDSPVLPIDGTKKAALAKTGDSSPLVPVAAVGCVAALSAAGTLALRRRIR